MLGHGAPGKGGQINMVMREIEVQKKNDERRSAIMFYNAVERGMSMNEYSLSRDDAVDIITGGLLRFLHDFKYQCSIVECEKELFYMAKATNALHGKERMKYTALLGLLASLDPHSRDCNYLESKIAEFAGVDSEMLRQALERIKTRTENNRQE